MLTTDQIAAEPFMTPDEAEIVLGVPGLGFIPFIDEPGLRLIRDISSFSPLMEAYRSLRTNVRFIAPDSARSLLVTSSVPAEGKSTTVANLAMSMAMSMALNNKRVVVVDADLRRPSQHKIFKVEAAPGLTDVLTNKNGLNEVLRPTHVDNLYLLPVGQPPHNPTELLESNGMGQVLTNLEQGFDMVILDSPPFLAVADAMVLAPQVDGVLVTIGYGETKKISVRKTMELLARAKANVLGTVLNRMNAVGSGYYYGKYYVPATTEPKDGTIENADKITVKSRERKKRPLVIKP